jgi:NTE family protein
MYASIRRIALSGGGAKGILHIGALQELSKTQKLEFPDGIYGSSVGAIIATCVAFRIPLSGILEFVKTHSSVNSVIPPKFQMDSIPTVFSEKGIYGMDVFEQRIVHLFEINGISIADKLLKDAHMPLYIVASNITKGKPAVFSENIRVIDALKCSCCIPLLFRPVELYGQMYIDGDILTPCIASIAPAGTVVISLHKRGKGSITPSVIDSISPVEYVSGIYWMIIDRLHKLQSSPTTVYISYPNLSSNSDLSEYDIDKVLDSASLDFGRFLRSQRLD